MEEDRIEKHLTSYHLGTFTTNINIPIKNTNLLKYKIPKNKIKNQNPFYQSSFNLWHTLNPIITPYSKPNFLEDFVFYNPSLLDEENNPFTPANINHYKTFVLTDGIPHQIKHFPVKRRRYKKEVFFLNQKITNAINKLPTNVGEEQFLTLTLNNKQLKAKDIISKMLYQNIAILNNTVQKTWEEKWSQTLNHPEWSATFQTLHSSIATYKTQSTVWQQITGAYHSQHQQNIQSKQSFKPTPQNPTFTPNNCKYCKQPLQNKHHFHQCKVIQNVYDHFLPTLNAIYNTPLTIEEKVLGLNNTNKNKAIGLRNFLTYTIRYITHKTRFCDFGTPAVSTNILIKSAKNTIRKQLIYFHEVAISKGPQGIKTFIKTFLINNILGNRKQKSLNITI